MKPFILLIPFVDGEPDFEGVVDPGISVDRTRMRRDGRDIEIMARVSRESRLDGSGRKVKFRIAKLRGRILGRLPVGIDPQRRFMILCTGNRWARAVLDESSGKVHSLAEAWGIPAVRQWMATRIPTTPDARWPVEGRPTLPVTYQGQSPDPFRP